MSNIILLIALLVSIIIHEVAHAWAADRLGDPTARLSGRLSLNPLAHIDLYGTILFPLLLVIIKSPIVFGWAKPVRFDPYNLKNPRRDTALISLAGPLSNLILAIISAILLRLIFINPFSPLFLLSNFFRALTYVSVVLAFFNLIPVHPLDGGKILIGLLPAKDAYEADRFLNRYGVIILFLLIFPTFGGTSPIFMFLSPVLNFILGILIPGNPII